MTRITIREVAKQAGVSIKTVSRVLNNEPFVKEVTRQRVQATINQLGYVVSLPARRLSSGQSYTIGLIFHNASWYYIQDVQKGVLETAYKFGYHTLMHPCDVSKEGDSAAVLNLVFQHLVDGLVFTPPADNASLLITRLQELQIPFVRLSPVDRESPLPYVTTSDEQGAYEMTAYLIGLGHRRIGYLQGPAEQQAPHDRFNGYRRALQTSGVSYDPTIVGQGDDHFESGYSAGSGLIQASPRPTAICCNNDEMAAGVVAAVFESGLRVPQDISVTGYDNIPLSRQIWPPLTTVEQPIFEMAEKATTHLIHILEGGAQPGLALELSTHLVIRKSTAPIDKP